ncbi:MAG: hypothetical protein M5U26_11680 [Planctomycetota bacterium]|nr:hypothetical protein [Planctomycetota bacterium]
MANSVSYLEIQFPFGTIVETRGDEEYHFIGKLFDLMYHCQHAKFKLDIHSYKTVDGVREDDLKFQVYISYVGGSEEIAHSATEASALLERMRRARPTESVVVRLHHWKKGVTLPPFDPEHLQEMAVPIRTWQWENLCGISVAAVKESGRILLPDAVLRGMVSAILRSGLKLTEFDNEHQVCNAILKALGRPEDGLPAPWEFDVVFQFLDGGRVVLMDRMDNSDSMRILRREVEVRRRLKRSVEGFFRRRRKEDELAFYQPVITEGGRRRGRRPKLSPDEFVLGAGI